MALKKKRLTREQSRAQTQEKILEAAAKAFARYGFAGASVDDITKKAGFSRGAFYANFESKDELFLILVERLLGSLTDEAGQIISASSSAKETLHHLRKFYIRVRAQDSYAWLLITEAQLYAARNTRFRARLAALFQEVLTGLTASLHQLSEQTGTEGTVAPSLLALIGMALSQGLMLYNLLDRKSYSNDVISAGMEATFDRMLVIS